MLNYSLQLPSASLVLHCSHRLKDGSILVFSKTYIGYCVQFLHQCHLSIWLPLIYSTIPITQFLGLIPEEINIQLMVWWRRILGDCNPCWYCVVSRCNRVRVVAYLNIWLLVFCIDESYAEIYFIVNVCRICYDYGYGGVLAGGEANVIWKFDNWKGFFNYKRGRFAGPQIVGCRER